MSRILAQRGASGDIPPPDMAGLSRPVIGFSADRKWIDLELLDYLAIASPPRTPRPASSSPP